MVRVLNCTDFDGQTFDKDQDGQRLGDQLKNVFNLMKDGIFRTLYEIEQATGYPTQSISARLRDLRKTKFGGFKVARRRCSRVIDAISRGGSWEYQLLIGQP